MVDITKGREYNISMEAQYIIAICLGGVYLILLFCYIFHSYKTHKNKVQSVQEMDNIYQDKNIKHIEYDLAFYDDIHLIDKNPNTLTSDEKVVLEHEGERALFNKVDEEKRFKLIGKFKS
jgi:hypothetical protein